MPRHLSRNPVQRAIEAVLCCGCVADGFRGIDMQWLGFPKRQQAEALSQIAIGQNDAGERRVADGSWMPWREPRQLCTDLRRGMNEKTGAFAIDQREGGVFPRGGRNGALPQSGTIRAAAVPLGESTAGRRP